MEARVFCKCRFHIKVHPPRQNRHKHTHFDGISKGNRKNHVGRVQIEAPPNHQRQRSAIWAPKRLGKGGGQTKCWKAVKKKYKCRPQWDNQKDAKKNGLERAIAKKKGVRRHIHSTYLETQWNNIQLSNTVDVEECFTWHALWKKNCCHDHNDSLYQSSRKHRQQLSGSAWDTSCPCLGRHCMMSMAWMIKYSAVTDNKALQHITRSTSRQHPPGKKPRCDVDKKHVYVCIHTQFYLCIYAYICIHAYICIYINMRMCMCACLSVCICTHVKIYLICMCNGYVCVCMMTFNLRGAWRKKAYFWRETSRCRLNCSHAQPEESGDAARDPQGQAGPMRRVAPADLRNRTQPKHSRRQGVRLTLTLREYNWE